MLRQIKQRQFTPRHTDTPTSVPYTWIHNLATKHQLRSIYNVIIMSIKCETHNYVVSTNLNYYYSSFIHLNSSFNRSSDLINFRKRVKKKQR